MLLEKFLGSGKNNFAPFRLESIQRFWHQRQAWITLKEVAMPFNEPPIQAIHYIAPLTTFVVTHLQ